MKRRRSALLALVLAVSAAAMPAWADRGGDDYHGGRGWHGGYHGDYGDHGDHGDDNFAWGLGVLFGSALLWSALQPRSAYYAPPVYSPAESMDPGFVTQYYASPTLLLPPAPSAAMVQQDLAPGGQWWYYCGQPKGYYPYVKQCQVGWEKVSPTPPGQ